MTSAGVAHEHKAVSLRVGRVAVIKRGPIEWRIVCRWCLRGGYRDSYRTIEEAHEAAPFNQNRACSACDRRE